MNYFFSHFLRLALFVENVYSAYGEREFKASKIYEYLFVK